MTTSFTGFSPAAVEFYDQLQVHNTRTWWSEHKAIYEDQIRDPMRSLVDALAEEFGPARIFRPNRDVRFSKDKSPYKEHIGAIAQIEDAVGYYVQLSAQGLMTAGGWYSPLGPQMARFRAAVDSPAVAALDEGLRPLQRARPAFIIDGAPLKTRPRGYSADHPRIEVLRFTQLVASREYGTPAWLHTRKVLDVVRRDWRAMAPMVEWLADHVGPGTNPADGD
jgi:uncharacterized protein (TIGR02453 family)